MLGRGGGVRVHQVSLWFWLCAQHSANCLSRGFNTEGWTPLKSFNIKWIRFGGNVWDKCNKHCELLKEKNGEIPLLHEYCSSLVKAASGTILIFAWSTVLGIVLKSILEHFMFSSAYYPRETLFLNDVFDLREWLHPQLVGDLIELLFLVEIVKQPFYSLISSFWLTS